MGCARLLRAGVYLLLLLLLTACATSPEAPVTRPAADLSPKRVRFELTGRIGIRNGEDGMAGTLRWLHTPEGDELWFSSPVGGSVAQLSRNQDAVELTLSDGVARRAATAEELTREALGWDLPLAGLEYWVLAQPAPGNPPTRIDRDQASGRTTRIRQDGWDIEYRRYVDTPRGALPALMSLEYGSLQIRLVIDRWDIPD
jgi:outer membrane lipoprotein LolB